MLPRAPSKLYGAKKVHNASGALYYRNQNAVRSQPLSNKLAQIIQQAAQAAGVNAYLFSGGQPSHGSARLGSHRHDNGMAGDVRLIDDNGNFIDYNTPAGMAIFQKFAETAAALGATGIGAGPGYMDKAGMPGIHVGFGEQSIWGKKGKEKNAPQWLIDSVQVGWGAPQEPTTSYTPFDQVPARLPVPRPDPNAQPPQPLSGMGMPTATPTPQQAPSPFDAPPDPVNPIPVNTSSPIYTSQFQPGSSYAPPSPASDPPAMLPKPSTAGGMTPTPQLPQPYIPGGITPPPQATPSPVPMPSFLTQTQAPPSPLAGSKLGSTPFGPPMPLPQMQTAPEAPQMATQPIPAPQAPQVPEVPQAAPEPPETQQNGFSFGGLLNQAKTVAGNAINTAKQQAIKTWMGSGPVELAKIAGMAGPGAFWNQMNTVPGGPTDTARASYAAGQMYQNKYIQNRDPGSGRYTGGGSYVPTPRNYDPAQYTGPYGSGYTKRSGGA